MLDLLANIIRLLKYKHQVYCTSSYLAKSTVTFRTLTQMYLPNLGGSFFTIFKDICYISIYHFLGFQLAATWNVKLTFSEINWGFRLYGGVNGIYRTFSRLT